MKKYLFVLVALLALLALVAVPRATTLAAADATCVSDPSSGPVGTDFTITCYGYTPNAHVYAYLVEPAGVATTLFAETGSLKVAADGSITYVQPSAYQPFVTLATGTWTFVAEELAPGQAVLHRGETTFRITGGTEGVSGASMSASPSTINKPEVAYQTFSFPPFSGMDQNYSEPVTLSGSGFAPNEMITVWVEPPQGGCPSLTAHRSFKQGLILYGLVAIREEWEVSEPIYDSLGSQLFGSVKADASGNASGSVYFTALACEGPWHFVARGNSSGWGAETIVTVIGNPVATDAWLWADKETVTGIGERINFSGSGFGANETVSCWLTSPRGQAIGAPVPEFFTLDLVVPGVGEEYFKHNPVRSDAGGNIGFGITTGSIFVDATGTITLGGVTFSDSLHQGFPIQSEGALGEWAMSCRGDASGATAITHFTVTGGFVDP
jgi:hypothetical protein